MDPIYTQMIVTVASALGGGGTVLLGYRLFKQKTEINDQQQFEQITALVKANDIQKKNNELQQTQIDDAKLRLTLLEDRFKDHRHRSEKIQDGLTSEYKKMDKVLTENTSAITMLNGTMKDLKGFFLEALKKGK